MELSDAAERSSAARITARRFFAVDPQECGALRQGNIALIHSAPTGEKGDRHCEEFLRRSNPYFRCGTTDRFTRNDVGSRQCPLWDFFIDSSCSGLAAP